MTLCPIGSLDESIAIFAPMLPPASQLICGQKWSRLKFHPKTGRSARAVRRRRPYHSRAQWIDSTVLSALVAVLSAQIHLAMDVTFF
jgi:hypothetical protein